MSEWERHVISRDGWLIHQRDVGDMFAPVLCDCGQVYDLGKVTMLARYADCSIWNSPCCRREQDDRPRGWGQRNYTELDRDGMEKRP